MVSNYYPRLKQSLTCLTLVSVALLVDGRAEGNH